MFSQKVIEWTKANGQEVTDPEEELFELYTKFYGFKSTDREEFTDPSAEELDISIDGLSTPITIHQNTNINSILSQTGGVVWDCSVIMSRFLCGLSKTGSWPFDEAQGIELGCGCGLVGIALHKLGTKRIILTDQQKLLRLAKLNVETNTRVGPGSGESARSSKRTTKKKSHSMESKSNREVETPIGVIELEWGTPINVGNICNGEPLDFVVISDCVYSEDVVTLLLSTLSQLAMARQDGAKTIFIIGQELRSEIVHEAFVSNLLKSFCMYRLSIDSKIDSYFALYVAWKR
ncbi:hypothetical protein H4219_003475 [Mycoemilia scoparia]|uniref:Uncharacterized protein n=1 Tax=Mycoemilia scoparia TaxID=417184 RepID=A0A9W8DSV9_9FUNG|nr:hypothetical protein H4219_003475 [Mycoemilia scoparia]